MKKYKYVCLLACLSLTFLSTPSFATDWGSKYGRSHQGKFSDLDRAHSAGEIRGVFEHCGAEDATGVIAYLVGRSFSALLTTDGDFTLSYVPPGIYSLAFMKNNAVLTTIDGIQVRKSRLTDLDVVDFCPDTDNDGFHASEDCNDNNPNIYPGAELTLETCTNGLDNNCDGSIDGTGADAGTCEVIFGNL